MMIFRRLRVSFNLITFFLSFYKIVQYSDNDTDTFENEEDALINNSNIIHFNLIKIRCFLTNNSQI